MAELGLPENVKGEGIVIGTIDTGISPGNSSFADVGDDGYDHTNPLGAGNYLGVCDPANAAQFDPDFACNDKLIGAYVFGAANEHGASTTTATAPTPPPPRAATSSTTCRHHRLGLRHPAVRHLGRRPARQRHLLPRLLHARRADGGRSTRRSPTRSTSSTTRSAPTSPSALWNDFDTVGFLNARAAGIFVATSNGNDGPGFATTGSPADAPWIMSVGAEHAQPAQRQRPDRPDPQRDATTLPDIPGKSVTGPLATPTPIIVRRHGR